MDLEKCGYTNNQKIRKQQVPFNEAMLFKMK
jgi:hypothetical protein